MLALLNKNFLFESPVCQYIRSHVSAPELRIRYEYIICKVYIQNVNANFILVQTDHLVTLV
jgi:hypothetical protein